MNRTLDEIEFTIFDTETTGLAPLEGDRILEIAAVRFKNGMITGEFQSFMNPQRAINPAAFAVNHISQDMVDNAPPAEIVIPEFMRFIEGSCICAYNASFDMGFLEHELTLLDKKFPHHTVIVDILKMSRRLMPGLSRHALWFVAKTLHIETKQEHRAMSDVYLTLAVFNHCMRLLEERSITSYKNFVGLFSISAKLLEDLANQKIAEIQEAIDAGTQIRMRYLSSRIPQVVERVVVPKEVRMENGVACFMAIIPEEPDMRLFRVDGVLSMEMVS